MTGRLQVPRDPGPGCQAPGEETPSLPGGRIVAAGTVEDGKTAPESVTGRYL